MQYKRRGQIELDHTGSQTYRWEDESNLHGRGDLIAAYADKLADLRPGWQRHRLTVIHAL